MAGGGPRPGAGRPKGSRNKATIEREIVAAEVRAGRIASGLASLEVRGKERLELLLDAAWRHMEEAHAAANTQEYIDWFMRSLLVAKSLTPYQSPQYRAIAVAHTDMR